MHVQKQPLFGIHFFMTKREQICLKIQSNTKLTYNEVLNCMFLR